MPGHTVVAHVRRACASAFAALLAALAASAAPAHEFKLDPVMTAFVRVDGNEAQLVIRAPLYLFKAVRFPIKGNELDPEGAATALQRALGAVQRDVTFYENGTPLVATGGKARLSLPSDRSFQTYELASAHVAAPMETDLRIVVDQGYVDARLDYAIRSPASEFAIRTTAAPELGDYLKLTVRYLAAEGEARSLVVDSRSGVVALNPGRLAAATSFIGFGAAHILRGYDHLLFLLCLIIPLRGWRDVLAVVTTFTLAHSLTLIATALGMAPGGRWFPPFVESLIAASIVYMAIEAVIGVNLRRRLVLAATFGLVHGFGLAYGLQEDLQFAGTHLLTALFAFNVGVEAGQLLVLALMLPVVVLVQRHVLRGRVGTFILAALAAHVGWHWLEERWSVLVQTPLPDVDATGIAMLLAWLAASAILVGAMLTMASRLGMDAPRAKAGGAGAFDATT